MLQTRVKGTVLIKNRVNGTVLIDDIMKLGFESKMSRPTTRVRKFQGKKNHSRNAGIPGIIPRNSVPHSGTPPKKKKFNMSND